MVHEKIFGKNFPIDNCDACAYLESWTRTLYLVRCMSTTMEDRKVTCHLRVYLSFVLSLLIGKNITIFLLSDLVLLCMTEQS